MEHDARNRGNAAGPHRERLEEELVHRFRTQRVREKRGTLAMAMNMKAVRWATMAVVLAVGAVACTSPTSTDVEMGQQVTFDVPADPSGQETRDDLFRRTKEIVAVVAARPDVDDVSVSVEEDGEGNAQLQLTVWGTQIDTNRMVRELTERYAALRGADVETQRLHTEITEPFYRKAAREVFQIKLEGASDEEMRTAILQQIHEAGYGDGSAVQVTTEGDLTKFEMKLEGEGTEDELILELQGEELPDTIGLPLHEDGSVDAELVRRKQIEAEKRQKGN